MKIDQIKTAWQSRYGESLPENLSITDKSSAIKIIANKTKKAMEDFNFNFEYAQKVATVWAIRQIARESLTDAEKAVVKYSQQPTKAEWRALFQAALAFQQLGLVDEDFEFSPIL